MILTFFKKFRKARIKSALCLSVYEVNIRDIQGSFLSLAILSHPSPDLVVRGEVLLLCQYHVKGEGKEMKK